VPTRSKWARSNANDDTFTAGERGGGCSMGGVMLDLGPNNQTLIQIAISPVAA
jgi:hypothetical protein